MMPFTTSSDEALAQRRRVAIVVGTRPEAIKLAPLHRVLARSTALRPVLISSGQHRELLDATLASLELVPDHDLCIMAPDQVPSDVVFRVFERLPSLLAELAPSAVVVQGDTTTALAAGLVAYYANVPLAHVEAGLRTGDLESPFPEEANRQILDRISSLCFAPTEAAADNLRAERIGSERVHVTGNTAVDALHWALERATLRIDPSTLLITLHRRESFGAALEEILSGVRDFVDGHPEARVLWPVHPNPRVDEARARVLADHPRVSCVAPMPYLDFAGALASCRLVLTDSGGIQEEAPSLGKTVLVARDVTDRPEIVAAGGARVVGRTRAAIRSGLSRAWSEPAYSGPLPAPNPYGDGHAAERIVALLEKAIG